MMRVILILLLALHLVQAQGTRTNSPEPEAVSRLQQLKNTQRLCFKHALPCVLLSSETDSVGCAQCREESVSAPVLEYDTDDEFITFLQSNNVRKRVLLVSEALFFKGEGLLKGLVRFRANVAAVVVYEQRQYPAALPGVQNSDTFPYPPPGGYSGDKKVPNEIYNHFLVFQNESILRPQNVWGAGFQDVVFPFNIFYIGAQDAEIILEGMRRFPSEGKDTRATSPRFKVESNGRMAACPDLKNVTDDQKAYDLLEKTTSRDCLKARTCRPVGGYSVWSSLDYLNRTTETSPKFPVVAVTSPLDSTALFHALAYGAAAEITSVAALMAIVKSVGDYSRSKKNRGGRKMVAHPMYFAFNGQSWGYAGSSRFLSDIKNFVCKKPDASKGICDDPYLNNMKFAALKKAEFKVINLGGLVDPQAIPPNSANFSFFLHSRNIGNSEVEAALRKSFDRTGSGQDELKLSDGFRLGAAIDASQSFQTFLPDADVTTLTNYPRDFSNVYFHSPFDNASFIQDISRKPVYSAAAAVAQAVIDLSFGDADYVVPEEGDLIDKFIDCLTTNWVEKNCSLAQEYLGGDYNKDYETLYKNVLRSNFAGVFVPLGHLGRYNPSGYGKLLFLQRFMAYHNRIAPEADLNCSLTTDCNSSLQTPKNADTKYPEDFRTAFCAREKCVIAESHLHGAFGTGLTPENRARSNYSVPAEKLASTESPTPTPAPVAPGWTESNWDNSLGMCYVIEDTPVFGGVILASGIGTFSTCLLVVWWFQRALTKSDEVDEANDGLLPVSTNVVL